MRDACPMVWGRMRESFCRASMVEFLGKKTLALYVSAVFDLYLDLLRYLAVDTVAVYKFSEMRQRRGQIFDRKFVSGDEII